MDIKNERLPNTPQKKELRDYFISLKGNNVIFAFSEDGFLCVLILPKRIYPCLFRRTFEKEKFELATKRKQRKSIQFEKLIWFTGTGLFTP